MTNFRTVIFAAAIAAAPIAAIAQTQQQQDEKPSAADIQKMKDECDARRNAAQNTGNAAESTATASGTAKEQETAMNSSNSSSTSATGQTSQGDAEDKNKEIVENAKPAPDGSKVAQTGPAKPVENWFGCPPEKTEDAKPKQ